MIYELKPCPFCGGKAAHEETPSVNGVSFSVGCTSPDEKDCPGFQLMTSWPTKKDAAKAWNRRYPDATISRLTEEVERLRAALFEAGKAAGALISPNASVDALANAPEQVRRLVASLRARAEAAEARVKDMEEALYKIASHPEKYDDGRGGGYDVGYAFHKVQCVALAALSHKEGK